MSSKQYRFSGFYTSSDEPLTEVSCFAGDDITLVGVFPDDVELSVVISCNSFSKRMPLVLDSCVDMKTASFELPPLCQFGPLTACPKPNTPCTIRLFYKNTVAIPGTAVVVHQGDPFGNNVSNQSLAALSKLWYSRSWAIIIAINQYHDEELEVLRKPEEEARALAMMLQREHDVQVPCILLGDDATCEEINANLSHPPWRSRVKPNDRVIFYFCGHSVRVGDKGFLCPVDYMSRNPGRRGINWKELKLKLSDFPGKHKLMILDCCYAGLACNDVSRCGNELQSRCGEIKWASQCLRHKAFDILTATSEREKTFEDITTFTQFITQGLGGKAFQATSTGCKRGTPEGLTLMENAATLLTSAAIDVSELHLWINEQTSNLRSDESPLSGAILRSNNVGRNVFLHPSNCTAETATVVNEQTPLINMFNSGDHKPPRTMDEIRDDNAYSTRMTILVRLLCAAVVLTGIGWWVCVGLVFISQIDTGGGADAMVLQRVSWLVLMGTFFFAETINLVCTSIDLANYWPSSKGSDPLLLRMRSSSGRIVSSPSPWQSTSVLSSRDPPAFARVSGGRSNSSNLREGGRLSSPYRPASAPRLSSVRTSSDIAPAPELVEERLDVQVFKLSTFLTHFKERIEDGVGSIRGAIRMQLDIAPGVLVKQRIFVLDDAFFASPSQGVVEYSCGLSDSINAETEIDAVATATKNIGCICSSAQENAEYIWRRFRMLPSHRGVLLLDTIRYELASTYSSPNHRVSITSTLKVAGGCRDPRDGSVGDNFLKREDYGEASLAIEFRVHDDNDIELAYVALIARVHRDEEGAFHKAGNMNNALFNHKDLVDGDFLLQLNWDMKPKEKALYMMLPHLFFPGSIIRRAKSAPASVYGALHKWELDKRIAFVQAPRSYTNSPNASAMTGAYCVSTATLEQRSWVGMSPYLGTNAIFRQAALHAVGGFSTECVSDYAQTTLKFHWYAYRSKFVNAHLFTGMGSNSVASTFQDRFRWYHGSYQLLFIGLRIGVMKLLGKLFCCGPGRDTNQFDPVNVSGRPRQPERKTTVSGFLYWLFFASQSALHGLSCASALLYILDVLLFGLNVPLFPEAMAVGYAVVIPYLTGGHLLPTFFRTHANPRTARYAVTVICLRQTPDGEQFLVESQIAWWVYSLVSFAALLRATVGQVFRAVFCCMWWPRHWEQPVLVKLLLASNFALFFSIAAYCVLLPFAQLTLTRLLSEVLAIFVVYYLWKPLRIWLEEKRVSSVSRLIPHVGTLLLFYLIVVVVVQYDYMPV